MDIICLISGHNNVQSNEIAHDVVKQGSFIDIGDVDTSITPPISNFIVI